MTNQTDPPTAFAHYLSQARLAVDGILPRSRKGGRSFACRHSFQRDDSPLERNRRGLSAVLHAELFEHMTDVQLNGDFGDIQRIRYLFVTKTLSDHTQHLNLAAAQRAMGPALRQMRGYEWIHVLPSFMNFTDGAQKFLADDVLHNISPRPGLHCAIDFLFAGVGGQHEDRRVRKLENYRRGAVGAAHSRQP